ncbi:MAG TPA: ThiF family adenylyltransferase [Acidimicrobiales bacterium]|jgi:hypothetical protein
MTHDFSIAIAKDEHTALSAHLTRDDGQEDVCFALWRPSTGRRRETAVIGAAILPGRGERDVHGTASFTGEYAYRAAQAAAAAGAGVAVLHSHPGATSWQNAPAGSADATSEKKIANLVRGITGQPLVGMTLGTGNQTWSARRWDQGTGSTISHREAATIRMIGTKLAMTYHPSLRPAPPTTESQLRTLHSWGDAVQADLARLRVLVVGAGSVGQLILEMLARTGVQRIGVMDFDSVEIVNLDRLHGATATDALLHRSKADIAARTIVAAATAEHFEPVVYDASVCEREALVDALDWDVIFSCVDRPWPRHVLNTIAYADAIPVIDGGVRLEPGPGGLRNAYWRSHVAAAGRACIRCVGQYDVSDVQLERDGSLDDSSYIANLPADSPLRVRQNVFAASLAAASAMTNQFLSLIVAPSGFGDPGPLRFDLRQHQAERISVGCVNGCAYRSGSGAGDGRVDPTAVHHHAREAIAARKRAARRPTVRLGRLLANASDRLTDAGRVFAGRRARGG